MNFLCFSGRQETPARLQLQAACPHLRQARAGHVHLRRPGHLAPPRASSATHPRPSGSLFQLGQISGGESLPRHPRGQKDRPFGPLHSGPVRALHRRLHQEGLRFTLVRNSANGPTSCKFIGHNLLPTAASFITQARASTKRIYFM